MIEILKEILHELQHNDQHAQAAKVFRLLGDSQAALESSVKANDWAGVIKAHKEVLAEKYDEVLSETILPALNLATSIKVNALRSLKQQFN